MTTTRAAISGEFELVHNDLRFCWHAAAICKDKRAWKLRAVGGGQVVCSLILGFSNLSFVDRVACMVFKAFKRALGG